MTALHIRLAGCGTRSRGEGRGSSCGETAAETRVHLRCRVHKVSKPYIFLLSDLCLHHISRYDEIESGTQVSSVLDSGPEMLGRFHHQSILTLFAYTPSCTVPVPHLYRTCTCSWLSRAIETAWLVLDELDLLWLPIIKTWRLNERYLLYPCIHLTPPPALLHYRLSAA